MEFELAYNAIVLQHVSYDATGYLQKIYIIYGIISFFLYISIASCTFFQCFTVVPLYNMLLTMISFWYFEYCVFTLIEAVRKILSDFSLNCLNSGLTYFNSSYMKKFSFLMCPFCLFFITSFRSWLWRFCASNHEHVKRRGEFTFNAFFCFMTMLGHMLPGWRCRSSLSWDMTLCHIHHILLIFYPPIIIF